MLSIRMASIVAVLLVTCVAPLRADEPAEGDVTAALLEELRRLNSNMTQLIKKIDALDQRIAAMEVSEQQEGGDLPPVPDWGHGPGMGGADVAALSKIKLPENPTREQVVQYVRDIVAASRGQSMFGSDDPQVAMLASVGREHLDVLVEQMGEHTLQFYMVPAVVRIATEDDKKLILDNLAIKKGLVEVVIARGWVESARQTLVDELSHRPRHLPSEWIDAVAQLRDPQTYDQLKQYFVNGHNRSITFRSIQHLPGIELDDAVGQAWDRARFEHEWERMEMAKIAANYGHLDALEALIDALRPKADGMNNIPMMHDDLRPSIFRVIDFRGSDEQIIKWFDENRKTLRFVPQTGKFVADSGITRATSFSIVTGS